MTESPIKHSDSEAKLIFKRNKDILREDYDADSEIELTRLVGNHSFDEDSTIIVH